MTLKYAHLAPNHKQKAVEMLDNTLHPKRTIKKLSMGKILATASGQKRILYG